MATRSNTTPTCSTSPALVTDAQIKRELVELMNVYGELPRATADEIKATIRSVKEGLAAFNIRPDAYGEAMMRLRIGGCHREVNDRRFMPKAPVIIDECRICEGEIRAAEYSQRAVSKVDETIAAVKKFEMTDEAKATAEQRLVEIRKRIHESFKHMPAKESARG